MDFDEWYREAKKTNDCGFTAKDFFEAGQQSKQAEIDALKEKILRIVESYLTGSDTDDMGDEIKEILK